MVIIKPVTPLTASAAVKAVIGMLRLVFHVVGALNDVTFGGVMS